MIEIRLVRLDIVDPIAILSRIICASEIIIRASINFALKLFEYYRNILIKTRDISKIMTIRGLLLYYNWSKV